MASDTEAGSKLGEAIERIGVQLGNAGFRRDFVADPQAALQAVGIEAGIVPDRILDALAELSTTELRLVGDLTAVLREHETGGAHFPL